MVKVVESLFEDTDINIRSLSTRIEAYRMAYNAEFFEEIYKKFKINESQKEDFELSILASAETYNRLLQCNQDIEPVYKAQNKNLTLKKKLIAAKKAYLDFISSPEATVSELFNNLDEMYHKEMHPRFFDFLHDRRDYGGGVMYNLGTISEFFDALINATEQSETLYNEGSPIKKNDPFPAWLSRMHRVFDKYSDLPFSQGKYYSGIGYVSETLEILYKIIAPLDPSITRQKLANKLKIYNAKKSQ